MYSRFRIALGLAVTFALALAIPAFAGGWAVVTLDELPLTAAAGEPLSIGFAVRQHGRTPTTGLTPTITATLPKEKQIVIKAKEAGKPGHYTATLILPKAGDWNWSIDAFGMDQPMPVISVTGPAVTAETQPVETAAAFPSLLVVRALAFGIGFLALLFTIRSKNRYAMAVTAVCLLVGVGSLMAGPIVPEVEAQVSSSSEAFTESSIPQAELGRRLFIAKGCLACHRNAKANESDYWTVDMGAPDLTNFSASPEALRLRLKDPALVKSDTQMPNLNLSEAEIEALIAFINSK